jgi:hypothetical protein
MIAPHPQRHAIAGIRQRQLAVRLAFTRRFRFRGVDLHVHTRIGEPVLRPTADFAYGEEFQHGLTLMRERNDVERDPP